MKALWRGLWTTRHTLRLSLRVDRRTTLAVGVLVIVSAGATSGTAFSQQWLVDAARSGTAGGLVGAVLVGAAAFTLSAVVLRTMHNYRLDLISRITVELDQEVMGAAARIPTLRHLEQPEYLDRLMLLHRGTAALAATGWAVVCTLTALLSLVLSLLLLADVHPLLSLLALCAVPILPLSNRARRLQRTAVDESAERVRHEEALHELCLTAEPGKEIRISGSGPELDRRANALWAEVTSRLVRARLRGIGPELLGWSGYFAGLAAALSIAAYLVIEGAATVGGLVLVVSLAGQLQLQLSATVYSMAEVADGGRVARHYFWLRDYAAAEQRGGGPAPVALRQGITLHNVGFRYPGAEHPVLRGINLTLPAGSTVGLVGVNGAGKSTLVKLLAGSYQPSEGTITVDGRPLSGIDPTAWARVCTGAFQDYARFQLAVQEAVGIGDLPRLADRAAVGDAVDRAGARPMVAGLGAGLDTQLGAVFDGTELSHGQWQRLALARGLMRTAPLLVLFDEPTAALDPQAEHDLFERFAEQARATRRSGGVTVLVSHRFSTVHMADHIVVLADGTIAEQGTHQQLLAAGGQYAELYRLQEHAYR